MATVGDTSAPGGGYYYYLTNASNVMAIQVTMPQSGTITALSAYFAGRTGGGSVTARLCIWDTSGNLLAQTGDITVAAGSGTVGGQSWQTGTLTTPYVAANGQTLRIGWWRRASQSDEWTENTGGTEYQATDSSNTAPPSSESFTSTSGSPGIYAIYTPSQAYVNTGTPSSPVWTSCGVFINTGTSSAPVWTQATGYGCINQKLQIRQPKFECDQATKNRRKH